MKYLNAFRMQADSGFARTHWAACLGRRTSLLNTIIDGRDGEMDFYESILYLKEDMSGKIKVIKV